MTPGRGGVLDEPIRVRRRNKLLRPRIWLPALLVLVLVVFGVRMASLSFPVFAERARPAGDQHRVLRGAFHLRGVQQRPGATPEVLGEAFDAGLDFVVLVDDDLAAAQRMARDAPLPVVAAQRVRLPGGSILVFGGRESVAAGGGAAAVLERVRTGGGWAVLAGVVDPRDPWDAWDLDGYQGVEFLHAGRQAGRRGVLELLGGWLAGLADGGYARAHLAVRPVEGLARWDEATRRRPVAGFCGLDTAAGNPGLLRAMSVYLPMTVEQAPYDPRALAAALRTGCHFCGLPVVGDPSGFRFVARTPSNTAWMGQTIALQEGLELQAELQLRADPGCLSMHLYLDGREIRRVDGTRLSHEVELAGAYRVEVGVSMPALPWGRREGRLVYSNPIYVTEEGVRTSTSP